MLLLASGHVEFQKQVCMGMVLDWLPVGRNLPRENPGKKDAQGEGLQHCSQAGCAIRQATTA